MVDLGNNGNNIQSGVHPFLVTSNLLNNRYSPNITGCSGTSQLSKSRLPVHTEIEAGMYGLPKKTIILAETLCPISKSKFKYKIGTVSDKVMKQVKKAIDIQNGELQEKTPLERLPQYIQDEINETLQYIYSYEKVLGRSQSDNLNHLLEERSMLLEHLEKICNDNGINYKDYYIPYTKERNVAVV